MLRPARTHSTLVLCARIALWHSMAGLAIAGDRAVIPVAQHGNAHQTPSPADAPPPNGAAGKPLVERLPGPATPPTASAQAQSPSVGVTLEAIRELACAHNPTLVQARAQVDGTLGQALQAGLWPNPVLGYEAEKIGLPDVPAEFQGGFIEQEIVTARKRRISREKYLARARAAEFVALAQQYRVVNDIQRLYWRTAAAERILTIREQVIKNAQDRLVTTEELFNVGQANTVNVRQARVELQRAKLELQRAVNDVERHRRELSALVGAPLPQGLLADPLDQVVSPLNWAASLAYMHGESPELREACAKLQSDQITVERERRQPIPNVTVRAAPGYDYVDGRSVVNAEVSFPLPVWDRNQGTIQQARADLARQRAEVRRIELKLERDLAERFEQYLTAHQHVEAYRNEVLPEAERAYQERLDAYKQRRQTWPMVLDSQSELYQRQIEYVRNLVTWRESQTLIEGFLLTGGLNAPPNPTPPGHIDATPQPR